MKRISLIVAAAGVCAVGAAHAQSWNHNTYEAGPGGTPPFAAYGYPPYSAPNAHSTPDRYVPPLPPVYQPPQPVYQTPPSARLPCAPAAGTC